MCCYFSDFNSIFKVCYIWIFFCLLQKKRGHFSIRPKITYYVKWNDRGSLVCCCWVNSLQLQFFFFNLKSSYLERAGVRNYRFETFYYRKFIEADGNILILIEITQLINLFPVHNNRFFFNWNLSKILIIFGKD